MAPSRQGQQWVHEVATCRQVGLRSCSMAGSVTATDPQAPAGTDLTLRVMGGRLRPRQHFGVP